VPPGAAVLPEPAAAAPITNAELAGLSVDDLVAAAAETSRQLASLAGRFMALSAELDRREGWRAEGATSLVAWMTERCGLAPASARTYVHVGERLFDLPHLAEALARGALSFDKARVLVDVADPETEAALTETARHTSVRELVEVGRTTTPPDRGAAHRDHESRSLRFNDACRTMTAQLGAETYAEVRACLEAQVRDEDRRHGDAASVTGDRVGDGDIRLDQRLADALVATLRAGSGGTRRSASPYVVVAHVPLAALVADDEAPGGDRRREDKEDATLFGELERGGLVSAELVRRLACEATVICAVDDDVGHTMYEGRARRDPTPTQRREILRRDRHCRFPGCANVTFTNAHHIEPWTPRGPTDTANLALLCVHHHARVHSKEWTMTGNANEELTFAGPSGRLMTSRPSPLWTRVSARPGRRGS
jgi:uncharacterized protein DUF222/HNH endonuclease